MFLALLLCIGNQLNAQSQEEEKKEKFKVGLSAGVNLNSVKQNLSNRVYSEYSGKNGIYLDVYGEYRFYGPLYVSAGIAYLKKDFEFKRTGDQYKGIFTDYNASYFDFPISVGMYILNPDKIKGLKMQLGIGAYVGYWSSLKRSGVYPTLAGLRDNAGTNILDLLPPYYVNDEKYDFEKNENQLNRFDYGLQGGIKVLYGISESLDISLGYDLFYGLSGIQKKAKKANPLYHTSSIIKVGLAYRIGFGKS